MSFRNALLTLGLLSLAGCASSMSSSSSSTISNDRCDFLDSIEKKVDQGKKKLRGKDKKDKKDKDKSKIEMAFGMCKAEAEKYCKEHEKNFSKLFDCLKENQPKLGPPCKAAVDAYRQKS